MNGELRPCPSAATRFGWVANAISVPSAPDTAARPRVKRSRARCRQLARELRHRLVVAAGIDDEDADVAGVLQVVDHVLQIGELAQVGLVVELGIDRREIVDALILQAVTGIEHQRRVGLARLLGEADEDILHVGAIEVGAEQHVEAEILQRRGEVRRRRCADWGFSGRSK